MTNFERLMSDKEELAYRMNCPHDVIDLLTQCEGKSCMECTLDWLEEEAEE